MPDKKIKSNAYHDRFFKDAISHKRTAQEFLKTYLPRDILEKVDLGSIEHKKESFIDNDLDDGIVDVLFSVALKNGEPGYLYLLTEQQTRQEHFMTFRLWKYVLRIMEHHLRQHPRTKKLPYVMPLVLYTGQEPYKAPYSFFDLFHDSEFARRLLSGKFEVIELNKISDEDLKDELFSGIMQLMLKNIRLPNILPLLQDISSLLSRINKENSVYTRSIILYILERGESKDPEKIIKFLSETFVDKQEEIMTIADQLMEKGRLEGIEKGIEKGRIEIARNLLLQGLDISIIENATGLSKSDLARLQKEVKTMH